MDNRALFAIQAQECRSLGSPFTARVLTILTDLLDPATPLGHQVLSRPAKPQDALPLRLAGALHALARTDATLAAVYPPNTASDADLRAALHHALTIEADTLLPWLNSPPQTNEVGRSAVLIAAAHWLTARHALPLHISELGASAGLNLLFDHYALTLPNCTLGPPNPALTLTPEWRGPLPPAAPPTILSRAGVDIAPLDPVTDRDRLLAYTWADQTARLDRTRAALTLAERLRPNVTQGDAGVWAATRLQHPHPGALHLIYHTVAATYFSPQTTARLQTALAEAGARATPNRPLAHLSMEWDGPTPGAALTLTLWPKGETLSLGRADFHGRWVDWHAPPP
jgi:hypothetical protein